MANVQLTGNFLATARCLIFGDGGGISWAFNPNTNTLTASATGGGAFVNSISSATLTVAGASNTPTINLSSTQVTNIAMGGTALQSISIATGAGLTGGPLAASGTTVALSAASIASLALANSAVQPGGLPVGANPSASVGLSANPGTAVTYMRSDGSPALSVTIMPTWTGLHTFNGGVVVGSPGAGTAVAITNATGNTLTLTGANGTIAFDSSGDQIAFSRNGFNFITATGAAATLQIQASGASGTVNISTNGAAALSVNSSQQLAAAKSILAPATTQVFTGLANKKTALSTAASAVLTSDAALTVTCNETGWYDVEAFLVFYEATLGSGGFQFDFNAGSATIANPVFGVNGFVTAAVANAAITSISTATGFGTVGTSSAAPSWVRVKGTIQVTVAGTFGIRWAQNTILASDPTTLVAGSSIVLTKHG